MTKSWSANLVSSSHRQEEGVSDTETPQKSALWASFLPETHWGNVVPILKLFYGFFGGKCEKNK